MKKAVNILAVVLLIAFCGYQFSSAQGKPGKPRPKAKADAEWKKILTPNQYYIMVEQGTEPPYKNAYFDMHEKGVFVSAATGDVLFTSDDKYDSGTGWPSFVKPVNPNAIEIRKDADGQRDEVIEKSTGLHLGHVFDDGPANRGGKRYCMNSGALKFVKK